jgi:hypothetical protein
LKSNLAVEYGDVIGGSAGLSPTSQKYKYNPDCSIRGRNSEMYAKLRGEPIRPALKEAFLAPPSSFSIFAALGALATIGIYNFLQSMRTPKA